MVGRTRSTSNSPTGHGMTNGDEDGQFTYDSLIGGNASPGEAGDGKAEAAASKAVEALSSRLTTFREWLSEEAGVDVHPSICIVNGEATDGTKNAPVLAFGPPPGSHSNKKANPADGRIGLVDGKPDRALYDRTMGCQVRTVREIKKDEVLMTVPRSAMVTPDLVASSDAGKAVLACCRSAGHATDQPNFWDAFENTTICEQKFTQKVLRNPGTQLLVKILQERKRAEGAYAKAIQKMEEHGGQGSSSMEYTLAQSGSISTRAPVLAFLIHQRFSNNPRPLVSSEDADVVDDFNRAKTSGNDCALASAKDTVKHPGAPSTFAPYARTLPSSVSLPLSWKRNELALLAGCIPGTGPLQEVATKTLQLASEFLALINAGILHRFPSIFPPGLITWERWVWAAVCMQSRILPASCYLNDGEGKATAHIPANRSEFQSPPGIWDELGVMVPLLDMVNHEVEAHQITWQPCVPSNQADNGMEADNYDNGSQAGHNQPHPPRAIAHTRVRRGSQIYCCYGSLSNQHLILQYGFAQLGNPLDEVRLGWGLADSVGNIARPADYELPFDAGALLEVGSVYDSTDPEATSKWWTEDRVALLEREAFRKVGESFMKQLKNGKKMMTHASSDGVYQPFLITAAAIGTMSAQSVKKNLENGSSVGVEITKTHQSILRGHLTYIFTRKMEKLLHNLSNGLKAHFAMLNLWTKATEGGLRYNKENSDGTEAQYMGWQTFFDANAYTATLEIENRYYAMGSDSCVLTLFDGQLRSLQVSLDGLSSELNYEDGVLRQLQDLGFKLTNVEEELSDYNDKSMDVREEHIIATEESSEHKEHDNGKMDVDKDAHVKEEETALDKTEPSAGDSNDGLNEEEQNNDRDRNDEDKDEKDNMDSSDNKDRDAGDGKDDKVKSPGDGSQKKKDDSKKSSPSKSSRRRNKRKNAAANAAAAAAAASTSQMGDRPPAIKLHIGNLAYSTTPSTLYEFFCMNCGRENVLECHIPTERDTGRSRGFGFVTLPEPVARNILKAGQKHEVDGRPLKIAESNSAGSGKTARVPLPPPMAAGERCGNCGYRPKYCVCRVPNVPGFGPPPPPPPPHMHPHGPPHGHPHGPPPVEMMDYGREYDYYGGSGGRFRGGGDRFSHSTSPYDRPRPGDRDRAPYGREVDREQWGHHYERSSRSRSHGRDSRSRDRSSRRERKSRDRSRSRSRSRSSRGRTSRRDREPSDRRYKRSSSRSRSYSSASSRSRSPPHTKRDYDASAAPSRKDKKVDNVASKEHAEETRAANAPANNNNKPRESRKRSQSRGGGRKKKKSKRRSTRSRSRSASPRGA